jgi:cephalosporin-C deacetylase
LMDTLCLPCTQFAAFNRIRSPKRVLLYPESGHETPPGFWDKACEFLADR